MTTFTWILIAVVIVVGWIALSPDPLANTLRARFKGAKARAADALDDAIDRIEAAEADADSQLVKANEGLIQIKQMRKAIEYKVAEAKAAIAKWQTSAENAASVQKQNLVVEALSRKASAQADLDQLQPQFELVLAKEKQVQDAVTALNKRKADLRAKKVQVRTRAKTAQVTIGVNELLAGVDLTGRQANVARAFEIVDELEAKAGAMAEIAETATAAQRVEEELEALSKPQTDVQAEAEALLAKFASKTSTS